MTRLEWSRILVFDFIQTDGIERFRYQPLQPGDGRIFIRTSGHLATHVFFFIIILSLSYNIPKTRTGGGGGGQQQNSLEEEKDYGFDRVKNLVPRQRQGGRQQNSLKKKKIMGSTASRPGPWPTAGGSTTELTGEEQEEKDCGSDRVKRPGPSPTAGGSTTELTEEEKDYGFDRVKDLVPGQRQGGRQQNSLKKKKIMGSTASKTWSLANGRGVDNRTHGRRTRRKRRWVRPRQKT